MKTKLQTVVILITTILCFCGAFYICQQQITQQPLTANDITSGKLNAMMAYEQFGDFLPESELPEGIPIKTVGPKIVYYPIKNYGCTAMKNPFVAYDKKGEELFNVVKIPGKPIIRIFVDNHATTYTYELIQDK